MRSYWQWRNVFASCSTQCENVTSPPIWPQYVTQTFINTKMFRCSIPTICCLFVLLFFFCFFFFCFFFLKKKQKQSMFSILICNIFYWWIKKKTLRKHYEFWEENLKMTARFFFHIPSISEADIWACLPFGSGLRQELPGKPHFIWGQLGF